MCIELNSRQGRDTDCTRKDSKGNYVCQRYANRLTEKNLRIWNTWNTSKDLGSLPFSGAIFDQPIIMVNGFMIISDEVAKYNYEKAKEASQK